MCIIMVKKPNAKMPSETILDNCFLNNPDGAGIMYNGKDGKVHITKGYMELNKFKKAYKDIAEQNPNATIVAHCRITTQGGVQKELCHPYPLTYKLEELRFTKCKCPMGVAHNGIISLTSEYGKTDRNDTMTFIKKYLVNIINFKKDYYKHKNLMNLIHNLIGDNNKLAILDGEGHVELINKFYKDDETGLMFSNESYKRTPVAKQYHKAELSYNNNYWWNEFYKQQCIDDGLLDEDDDMYMFDPTSCPMETDGDDSFCDNCLNEACICSRAHYRKI